MARRIRIHGVKRSEIDADLLAYVYFLEGKRRVQQRRACEAREKAKRLERETGDSQRRGGVR